MDAIVGGGGSAEEVVLRDVARREPGVLFLPAVHGPREATLRQPAPNLYRFAGDYGQGAAGLGTYAYRNLGWRRAAIVLTNWDVGWGPREAFAAEFCAAGGRVVSQTARGFLRPRRSRPGGRPPSTWTAWRCSPRASSAPRASSRRWRDGWAIRHARSWSAPE